MCDTALTTMLTPQGVRIKVDMRDVYMDSPMFCRMMVICICNHLCRITCLALNPFDLCPTAPLQIMQDAFINSCLK